MGHKKQVNPGPREDFIKINKTINLRGTIKIRTLDCAVYMGGISQ